ncbi:nascent polypeptide-associated complex subunit alpha, muscle-specific form-like isoform X2 [Alosa sapidissima]|uniref:nascent polypeptide-associated complex subunit alpha, muscle-specific form-like isoform X2 n=1 Tax=Alosa sapidissima TaxID=34773 RepID=UPI001C0810B2|nr:nascent polypeptide-associated complex subunit alpha, muscle-specific form-like isoform X2 [Alosa sapidissima]
MASVGRQNLQVWMFWLLIASCGGLKEDDVLKSPKKEIFTRRDYSNHAKSSPQPSIKRVVYYGHLTMGTKKLNLSAEGNPIANDAELFSGSFGDSTDYQSDSSHVFKGPEGVAEGVFSQNRRTPAVDRLLGMKPKVECVENSMTLKLHGAAPLGVPFHIDRGNAYPLSLSEMPSVCGYTMRRSWRDLVFSTPYDGCFVAQKESIYVLPLVIYGIPVRMACPSVAPTPPSVTCHASGMTVKMESSASVKDVQVKVNRKWESLMKVSPQCGFSVVEHPDGVIISVKYLPCIEEQDGMFTFEVAAKGDFKISCPSLSSMHAMATACPESSSTACSPTSLDGPLNLSQTLTESITSSPPSDQSKYQNVQFPYVYNPEGVVAIHEPEVPEVPQLPPRPVLQPIPAPPDTVYPKKPAPVENPSKSIPPHTPGPVQYPAQFPFYSFKPEFYQPAPKPDGVSPKPELSEVPQLPERPVPQTTRAPLGPVYMEKPTPVEDPSKNMPDQNPEHMQSAGKFPSYFFEPGFYPPDLVPAISEPKLPEVPQHPQRPVLQSTPAPKKPAPVKGPPKSMPDKHPEHGQFPFYFFKPGFYPPDHVPAIPESDYPKVPELPQRPVSQPSLAPLDPVYPTKPAPVQDPPRSMPDKHPEHGQFPFYFFKPGFYPPDHVPAIPESDYPKVPELPQRPVSQPSLAPLDPVYPTKPAPVQDPPRSMPDKHPEHGQFPFSFFKPGFYPPDHVPAISESDYPKVPELPRRPVSQPSLAPLDPVYPTKPAPVQDPPRSMPDKHPEHGQFPFYFFKPGFYPPDHVPAIPESDYPKVPELPQRPVSQPSLAPLDPVYPTKPAPVQDPPRSMPDKHPEHGQFPFYFFKPGFYPPDHVPAIPESDYPKVPELPQRPVSQPSLAPLDPVYPTKPAPVQDPPRSMPDKNPEHGQFPFYSFKPEFCQPAPKPDCVSPSPKPELSEVPQLPERPVPQATQAPLGPVYMEKPTPVEDPSKNMPDQNPEHMQSAGKFPFSFFKPGFYPPDHVPAISESDYPKVPELPRRPVSQPSLAPLDPVYPTKPAPVQDPPRSMPDKHPEHGQFPFYFFKPGFYPPDHVPAIPESDYPKVPELPQRPVSQPSLAPLDPVYPTKPAPVQDPPRSMPDKHPEHGQFPFYFFKPGFYPPDHVPAIPESDYPKVPELPQRPVSQPSLAPLDPVYPTKPAPVQDPPRSMPDKHPEHGQFPFYFFKPGFYPPDHVPAVPESDYQVPELPGRPVPQTTRAPLGPFYPKRPVIVVEPPLAPSVPAHPPTEVPIHHVHQLYPIVTPPTKPKMPIPQSPSLVPIPTLQTTEPASVLSSTTAQKTVVDSPPSPLFDANMLKPPNRLFHQSTHCPTVCTLAHSNCCPLALSFHQHFHHHNHFAPAQNQVVQPASATSDKEPTYIQQLSSAVLVSKLDPAVKPISPQAHQLPTSKLHSNQPVKEPLPYQWAEVHTPVHSALSLNLPLATSGLGPQAVPTKVAGNGNPKSTVKPGILNVHPKNIGPSKKKSSPQSSSSGLSGEYFATHGSPLSSKHYWKPVRPHHTY